MVRDIRFAVPLGDGFDCGAAMFVTFPFSGPKSDFVSGASGQLAEVAVVFPLGVPPLDGGWKSRRDRDGSFSERIARRV